MKDEQMRQSEIVESLGMLSRHVTETSCLDAIEEFVSGLVAPFSLLTKRDREIFESENSEKA